MSEATGSKPYSEDEAYLYETYVTEDGIEVPPPTKVMGPRRLARYREEVAEYLRAARRGEPAKPVENMGSVIYTNAIDPQVLAVQRRFAALAAQGKIDTEANDEEKLHEPAPLTSSLRVLRPEEIAQNRVDATSPSAVNNPMTSSIPVIAVVKEEKSEPELHQYLVPDGVVQYIAKYGLYKKDALTAYRDGLPRVKDESGQAPQSTNNEGTHE